ncbi:tripartite motif-containing protein 54-like [Ahaetulla prasina]|uniref:tripartite motif-containing protein 54-like n=1 Tax=Ahaetulla prasina TaxID=499056 RepID=UPI0026499A2D|nr:tripartite motif-containing protein 54-like [Ahaetulla prasina]
MSKHMEYTSYPRDCPTMENLERQLICPICLEMFTKPVVILPCQHNLCRKCANDIFQSRGTTLGSAGRFRCPSCRHEVVLDRHGIYGLQRNLLVENIIDIYKQASARGPERPLLKTEHPTCEEHEEERINIYCVTCAVPTCSLCKVFGEHKECEVAPLSDICTKRKAELTNGIAALVAANDRIQTYTAELQGRCRNIEANCKAQKQALCEKFDRMGAILEERRKIMLQRITYEQESKAQHLNGLSKVCSDHIETSSKLVDTALQSMEEPQMSVFVQNAKVLIRKIVEMSDSCQPEVLEPGYDNMEHYTVDFNAEERILYQLDFIKVEDPELTAEEEGGCGEPEDALGEAEPEGGEREEDLKDSFALGKEDPWQGISLLVNGTQNGAAVGAGASTPELAQSLAETSQESNIWSTQQGQPDGGLQVTDSTPPSPSPEGDLADNGPPQSREQSPGEDFSTTESSAENREGGGPESQQEPKGEHVLLEGMASTTSQAPVSSPTADRWRSEDFAEPLLSSCFNPTLWLHD